MQRENIGEKESRAFSFTELKDNLNSQISKLI